MHVWKSGVEELIQKNLYPHKKTNKKQNLN